MITENKYLPTKVILCHGMGTVKKSESTMGIKAMSSDYWSDVKSFEPMRTHGNSRHFF